MAIRLIAGCGIGRWSLLAVVMAVLVPTALPVLAQTAPVPNAAAGQDPGTQSPAEAAKLDDELTILLTETLSANDYREASRCLNRRDYRDVDIINSEFLLFSKHGKYYLNRLEGKCHGLSSRMVLTLTSTLGSLSGHLDRYCQHDVVYVSERFDLAQGFDPLGRPIAYRSSCALGEFEVIDEQQMLALKETM
jgi:hypothetical protein